MSTEPREKAKQGLQLLEEAIIDVLAERGDWVKTPDLRDELNLHSHINNAQRDYLLGSIIQRLIDKNKVVKEKEGKFTRSKLID